jgi:hypothetical protein
MSTGRPGAPWGAGEVAQMLEHLPNNREILSSTQVPPKRKKETLFLSSICLLFSWNKASAQ